ncbi:hypothetical protein [Histidinibacterium aquaticum]|uniref:Uncharacterized protein n=1 Tax=Histidinibacterium aquaticum TaxID=2613962 RepID=A0A5J5GC64_9RHOB|nr:hypothetical protein [Histidinibacterium aquaticum]KAA9005548.1 hypothetical protein F3S47_16725 [Histidinibacterium aquaticum]
MSHAPILAFLAGLTGLPVSGLAQEASADPSVGVWQLVTPEGVTFTVESAIARDLIGQELERTYEVADDRLTLEPTSADESWSVTYARRGEAVTD